MLMQCIFGPAVAYWIKKHALIITSYSVLQIIKLQSETS